MQDQHQRDLRILVVDDNHHAAMSMSMLLGRSSDWLGS
jgi:hypothetical protein